MVHVLPVESLELPTQIDVDGYNFCQILGYVGPRSVEMKKTVQCTPRAVESLELPRQVPHSVYRVKSWTSLKPGWVSGGRLVGCLGTNSSLSSKCWWFLKVNTLSIFSGSVRSMGSFCASLVLCLNLDRERTAFSVLGSYSPSTPQIWRNVRYEG